MNDSNTSKHWPETAEVFLGTLHTLESPSLQEVGRAVYLSYFEDNEGNAIGGQSDWLIAGNEQPASAFRFLFHSKTTDRLHFMITGSGTGQHKKVGVSRNGYLGLYAYASVSEYIKVEPLEWGDNHLICRLRDAQGHIVKASHNSAVATPRFSYLNVQQGTELRFLLKRVNC